MVDVNFSTGPLSSNQEALLAKQWEEHAKSLEDRLMLVGDLDKTMRIARNAFESLVEALDEQRAAEEKLAQNSHDATAMRASSNGRVHASDAVADLFFELKKSGADEETSLHLTATLAGKAINSYRTATGFDKGQIPSELVGVTKSSSMVVGMA